MLALKINFYSKVLNKKQVQEKTIQFQIAILLIILAHWEIKKKIDANVYFINDGVGSVR